MKSLLEYTVGNTLIHRMNPLVKLLLALCVCAAAFASDSLAFIAALLALDLALGAAGGVFTKALRLLAGLLKAGLLLFVLQLLFCREGRTLFLFVTDLGVLTAAKLVLRFIAACMPLALMLGLTRPGDLTNALVKPAHVPYKYAFTLSAAIRFIPLFMSEMEGVMEAQASRGVDFDGGPLKRIRLVLPLCVPLLMISVRKIDGAAVAAEARGFHLRSRSSGYKAYPLGPADLPAAALCAVLVALGIIT
jgi:energy-coupling factor transport system permease protein